MVEQTEEILAIRKGKARIAKRREESQSPKKSPGKKSPKTKKQMAHKKKYGVISPPIMEK